MFGDKRKIEALEEELQRLHMEVRVLKGVTQNLTLELGITSRDVRYLIKIVENFFPRPKYPSTTGIGATIS